MRVAFDHVLVVARNRLTAAIELPRTVLIEFV